MKENLQINNTNFSTNLLEMIKALPSAETKMSGVYLWSKKEAADGDIVGYATGDVDNAYPDGGWAQGYYWGG